MFHLTIDCETCTQVSVIASLADIVNNEGDVIANPDQIGMFVFYLLNGLQTIRNEEYDIHAVIGDIRGSPELREKWLDLLDEIEEVADEIRKLIPNSTAQSSEPT